MKAAERAGLHFKRLRDGVIEGHRPGSGFRLYPVNGVLREPRTVLAYFDVDDSCTGSFERLA
jgi:hypothetical protein